MSFEHSAATIPYQYKHPKLLYGLIRWLEPQIVVEVGTHIGMSAVWMARALQENNHGRLYCIDPFCWVEENQEEQWVENLEKCGVRDWVTLIKERSQIAIWPPYVEFAYIDGNHTYDACKLDVKKAFDLGASVICMHDTVSWEGSRKLSEEWQSGKFRLGSSKWTFMEDYTEEGILIAKKMPTEKPACKGKDIGEKWDV